jgi:tRNA modification GTPase
MTVDQDTIFALATAPGKAGVAVVRLSGSRVSDAAKVLFGDLPKPRAASLRVLRDPIGVRLDEALVLYFPLKASFTGEEVLELQLHGSVAVVNQVLRVLGDIEGLRLAEPGEFTRRALENGCMDLAQVEGLADLIEAETEAQRRQALRVLAGDLGKTADVWRQDLIRAAALIEATIDFVDEDVPVDVTPEVTALLEKTLEKLKSEIAGVSVAERIRTGFEVAILGAPNVGKSTLLNALAGRDAAITSEIAGTTRDVIEVRMDLKGLPVTILDTAGLRETNDVVEGIGIERAKQRAAQADLRVYLVHSDEEVALELEEEDILLRSKSDISGATGDSISAVTGHGVNELVDRIADILAQRSARSGVASRERHRVAMQNAVSSIQSAMSHFSNGESFYDLGAEDLRSAVWALDSIVGRIDVENLLDVIFSSFCIGK